MADLFIGIKRALSVRYVESETETLRGWGKDSPGH